VTPVEAQLLMLALLTVLEFRLMAEGTLSPEVGVILAAVAVLAMLFAFQPMTTE